MRALRLGTHQAAVEIKLFLRDRAAVVFILLLPVILLGIFGSVFTWTVAVTGWSASGTPPSIFETLQAADTSSPGP